MLLGDIDSFKDFLKLKQLSPKTIKSYTLGLIRFNSPFTQEYINKFLVKHNNTRDRGFLKAYQEYLISEKENLNLSTDQLTEIVNIKFLGLSGRKKRKLIIPLSTREVDILINNLQTEELKLMALLCYNTGLRLQELISIKIGSFDWEKMRENPASMGEVKVLGKGGKEGIALVPNEIIKKVARYIKSRITGGLDSPLFKVGERSFEIKLKEAGIRSRLTRINLETGEPIKETITNPHRLRHSYATNLLKAGVPINTVKELMRHASISSTEVYLHLTKKDIEKEVSEVNY